MHRSSEDARLKLPKLTIDSTWAQGSATTAVLSLVFPLGVASSGADKRSSPSYTQSTQPPVTHASFLKFQTRYMRTRNVLSLPTLALGQMWRCQRRHITLSSCSRIAILIYSCARKDDSSQNLSVSMYMRTGNVLVSDISSRENVEILRTTQHP